MAGGLDLTPEVLTTQGRALRGLARSLLGDEHAAEDVVQETWLACLKRPAALPGRVGGWLTTVTKHLALRRARGERRRERREERAAAPERLEALQQRTLEREEALRAVTAALLALEEPFKTALFLRYFEDRTPADIAGELDLPLATVKSRLARGLERMRAKLGPAFGGDVLRERRALLALAALPAPGLVVTAAGATAAATALTAGVKLPAAVAALALACGALWWWSEDGDERAAAGATAQASSEGSVPATLAASGPERSAANSASRAPADESSAPQRSAVGGAEAEPVAVDVLPPEAAFAHRVRGQVRDERDLPLAGARVYLAPRGFPWNLAAETDDEGRFDVAFDARSAAFDCALAISGGAGLAMREVHLVSGRPLEVDVGVQGGQAAFLRTGSQLVELSIGVAGDADGASKAATRLFLEGGVQQQHALGDAPEMLRRADGRRLFVEPAPGLACPRPRELLVRSMGAYLERPVATEFSGGEFHLILGATGFSLDPAAETPAAATVRGVVRDASGAALAGVEVGWGPPRHTLMASVRTDEQGAFVLEGVPAGEHVLRAGGGEHPVFTERTTLGEGQDLAWSPLLERGAEVTGRLVGADGKPLAAARVELWSGAGAATLWSDSTVTNEDGRFAFPDAPSGELDLVVHAPGTSPGSAFPIHVARPVFARSDLGTLALAAGADAFHTLSLAVLDPDGEPYGDVELRAWHLASGAGRVARGVGEDGRATLANLPRGAYRVELGGRLGWHDLGTVFVEDEDLDLGTERFTAAGVLELALAPDAAAQATLGAPGAPVVLGASVWSAHPDVFARVEALEPLGQHLLALRAGDYVLCASGAGVARSEAPFAIDPARGTSLTVAPAGDRLAIAPGPALPALDAAERLASNCASCHAGVLAETAEFVAGQRSPSVEAAR